MPVNIPNMKDTGKRRPTSIFYLFVAIMAVLLVVASSCQ